MTVRIANLQSEQVREFAGSRSELSWILLKEYPWLRSRPWTDDSDLDGILEHLSKAQAPSVLVFTSHRHSTEHISRSAIGRHGRQR